MCTYIHQDRMHKAKERATEMWVKGWYCELTKINNEESKVYPCIGIMEYHDGVGNYQTYIVKPDTLCRCTGETDMDGNVIWEKDIVLRENGNAKNCGIILYGNDDNADNGFYIKWDDPWLRRDLGYWHDKIKVTENAHDKESQPQMRR